MIWTLHAEYLSCGLGVLQLELLAFWSCSKVMNSYVSMCHFPFRSSWLGAGGETIYLSNCAVSSNIKTTLPIMSISVQQIKGKVSVECSFRIHFHDFANLSTTRGHRIASPEFTCNGHQWELRVYPGGDSDTAEGQVSVYLCHLSDRKITVSYDINVIDKFGKQTTATNMVSDDFTANQWWGWKDFMSRSKILDESKNILDDNGTLTFVVHMQEEPTPMFVPKNPLVKMVKEKFNDEATADVCFEVGSADEKKGKRKKTKSSVSFYAHRLILEMCAPMLAALCESNDSGGVVTALVNDIKPEIFQHLLSYVYGGTISEKQLKTHAKDIIDAADKYSIVNLKLEAEAVYVKSTKITFDNAMDDLLYADSRNLALLKEAVVNFLADNHREAVAHINFTDFPGHVVKDLFIAFSRNSETDANGTDADELTTLSVSELRRKLDEKGLEVDGSREAMIESIKSHSEEATLE